MEYDRRRKVAYLMKRTYTNEILFIIICSCVFWRLISNLCRKNNNWYGTRMKKKAIIFFGTRFRLRASNRRPIRRVRFLSWIINNDTSLFVICTHAFHPVTPRRFCERRLCYFEIRADTTKRVIGRSL